MSSLDVDSALAVGDAEVGAQLASLPEDQWFDRKSGRIAAKDLARPLVAFANAEGGTIAIGIRDGAVDGVSAKLANELRQAPIDFTVPPVRARFLERVTPDGTLLIVDVDPGEMVHTDKSGTCYLRIGDESRRLSLAEQQELTFDRGGRPYDATPVDLALDDLHPGQLESYRTAIGSSSAEEMLRARDLVTRRGELTVAATLLFDARPQREFPSAFVRVIRYDRDERGVGADMSLIDEARIDGPLPDQIEHAAEQIDAWVPTRQQLAQSGRFERVPIIPRDVWLEGLVNAVVHRSYSMMGDHIRVEIFPHRIEVSSPGRFPGLVDPTKPLQISRYARNPRIARVCSDLGITRELGEGIKRMFAEMQRRGLADPMYRQMASSVTVVLSSADAVTPEALAGLPKSAGPALDALRLAGRPLGTGQVAEFIGVARPTAKTALRALADAGLVRWEGSSERDPRASWHLL